MYHLAKALCLILTIYFSSILSPPVFPAGIGIDGDDADWDGLEVFEVTDREPAIRGSPDIITLKIAVDPGNLFFLIQFRNPPGKDTGLRYFINIDTDFDGIAEFQAAAVFSSPGDTSRFRKDWSTYDYRVMNKQEGLESAVGDAVELKLPARMFGRKKSFRFQAGVYDTKKQLVLDSISGVKTDVIVDYHLKVIDASLHQTEITMKVREYPSETAILSFLPFIRPDIRLTITHVNLKLDGKPSRGIEKKGDSYIIQNIKNEFEVTYSLQMDQFHQTPVYGPTGYLCSTYLLSSTYWTFLFPGNIPAKAYTLSFTLPKEWNAITPFSGKDGVYYETDDSRFKASTFAAGQFELQEKNIHGTNVSIAIHREHDPAFRSKLFDDCFSVFTFVKSMFPGEGPARHLSIFTKPQGINEWQSYNEAGESEGESVGDMKSAVYQFTHRIVHTFNAFYPWGMNIEPTWFMEGMNEYIDYLALFHVQLEMPLASLASVYFNSYLPHYKKLDGSLSGNTRDSNNWQKEDFLAYKKGALVSYLLDREMRRLSKNKVSLFDLCANLHLRYNRFATGIITDKIIEETTTDLIKHDISGFFETYIQKSTFLDMKLIFSDDDRDNISAGGEELVGTDPSKTDTDGDRASDGYEVAKGTNPLSSASTPSEIVFVDGSGVEWEILHPVVYHQEKTGSGCDTDISKLYYIVRGNMLFVLIGFVCPVNQSQGLRFYLNIDIDNDGIGEKQCAAVYGQSGDTCCFNKDWTSYDNTSMDDVPGLESAAGEIIEFQIPISLFPASAKIRVSAGVWDTKTGKALDSTPWLDMSIR